MLNGYELKFPSKGIANALYLQLNYKILLMLSKKASGEQIFFVSETKGYDDEVALMIVQGIEKR